MLRVKSPASPTLGKSFRNIAASDTASSTSFSDFSIFLSSFHLPTPYVLQKIEYQKYPFHMNWLVIASIIVLHTSIVHSSRPIMPMLCYTRYVQFRNSVHYAHPKDANTSNESQVQEYLPRDIKHN